MADVSKIQLGGINPYQGGSSGINGQTGNQRQISDSTFGRISRINGERSPEVASLFEGEPGANNTAGLLDIKA